ncbi:hypothetical protein V1509DRAFT_624210 [Lipomyces kononenkoae]
MSDSKQKSSGGGWANSLKRKHLNISNEFSPSMESCLLVNWIDGYADMTRQKAAVEIIRLFLAKHDVNSGPRTTRDLFPADWQVGSTVIPIDFKSTGGAQLRHVIPNIQAYGQSGKEIHWVGDHKDMTSVFRIKADWIPPVDLASGVLSALVNQVVTQKEVLEYAQKSPQSYAKLKNAVATYKAHFNRMLDPVSLRRDPKFNETAAMYSARLRSLTAKQQDLAMQLRQVNREMDQVLSERDAKLSSLDPGYKPKHRIARAEQLPSNGISQIKEEDTEYSDAIESISSSYALEDLEF